MKYHGRDGNDETVKINGSNPPYGFFAEHRPLLSASFSRFSKPSATSDLRRCHNAADSSDTF
jgi:hypothetical protein